MMKFPKRSSHLSTIESDAWDEQFAGTVAQHLREVYTATHIPPDLHQRIDASTRAGRLSADIRDGRHVRFLPRIATSALTAAVLLVIASVLIAHNGGREAGRPRHAAAPAQRFGPVSGSQPRVAAPAGAAMQSTVTVEAGASYLRPGLVSVEYSVKPTSTSTSAAYLLQSPHLYRAGEELRVVTCPTASPYPSAIFRDSLCFELPPSVGAVPSGVLRLQSDGLRTVNALATARQMKGKRLSMTTPAEQSHAVVVHTELMPGGAIGCSGAPPPCRLPLEIQIRQRLFSLP